MNSNFKHNYPLERGIPLFRDMREFLTVSCEKFADSIAFTYRIHGSDPEPQRISFRRFYNDVRAIGTRALAGGCAGTHCALIGRLSYDWICCYFALLSIGAVLVPLDREWTEADLVDTVKRAECVHLFCDGDLQEKATAVCRENGIGDAVCFDGNFATSLATYRREGEELISDGDCGFDTAPIDPKALALLVFTSGTTGQGKGVMHNQRALLHNIYGAYKVLRVFPRTIGLLPPHHTFGSTISILATVCGGSNMYISSGLRYILHELKEHKPQYLILVPLYLETFWRLIWASAKETGKDELLHKMINTSNALRKVGIDMRSTFFKKSVLSAFGGELCMAVSGGAPISQEIVDGFDALGVTVVNGYGITECAPLIAANRLRFRTPGSVGVPIPDVDVKIVNPTETGEGEICVKGPNVMMGYYKNPQATVAAIDKDGYFHTGDIGRLDKKGCLYITGRLKNLIILSNGKNVYPEEIEGQISDMVEGIKDLVVYEGISRRGVENNAIVLEVFPDEDFMKKEGIADFEAYLRPYVEQYNRTAVPYKKIGLIRVRTEDFPKNTLRKITRFKLDRSID